MRLAHRTTGRGGRGGGSSARAGTRLHAKATEQQQRAVARREAHLREAARAEVADAGFSPTITARARKLKPPEKVEDRNMRWWEKSLQKREQAYLRSAANPEKRALDDI